MIFFTILIKKKPQSARYFILKIPTHLCEMHAALYCGHTLNRAYHGYHVPVATCVTWTASC